MKKALSAALLSFFAMAALTIDLSSLPVRQAGVAAVTYLRQYVFADSLTGLCAWLVAFMLIYFCPKNRGYLIAGTISGTVYTIASVFAGGNVSSAAFSDIVPLSALTAHFLGSVILFSGAFKWFDSLIPRVTGEHHEVNLWLTAGIIFVLWLPWLLIAFPGTLHNDAWDMIGQVTGTFTGEGISRTAAASTLRSQSVLINDTQPVIYTLFVGGMYMLCDALGNAGLSVFIIGLIQLALGSLVIARCIRLMGRLGLKKGGTLALTAFFALFPLFPMYISSTMKDAAFAIALLSYLCFALEIHIYGAEALKDRKKAALGVISLLTAALLRGQAVYLILLTLPGLLIELSRLDRHVFRRGAACLLVPVMAYFLITYAVYPLCRVGKGPQSEKMALMLQQSALCLIENPGEATEEQLSAIDEVIGLEELESRFEGGRNEGIKYAALSYTGDYSAYRKAWLEMFKERPGTYLRAFCAMSAGYWELRSLPTDGVFVTGLGTDPGEAHAEYAESVQIRTPEGLLKLCNMAVSGVRALCGVTPFNLMAKAAPYLYALIFALAFAAKNKKSGSGCLWALLVYGAFLGFTAVSGSTRYAFPLMLCTPCVIVITALSPSKNKKAP